MPRQSKAHASPAPVAGASPADALSREALAATLPELSEATADLVGWVTQNQSQEHAARSVPQGRRVLAAALGVPDASLTRLRDEDVEVALERLRTLVEQCSRLVGQVAVDELTGALRRGAGLAALQREMDRTRRLPGKGLVVIFVDVDGLKDLNDREGHAAGDDRLRATVTALRERLRSYDLVIRYGGDEFICVLTDSGAAEGERTAATLRRQVEQRTGGTISVGVAELTAGETVDMLVDRADGALYQGRRARGHQPRATRT